MDILFAGLLLFWVLRSWFLVWFRLCGWFPCSFYPTLFPEVQQQSPLSAKFTISRHVKCKMFFICVISHVRVTPSRSSRHSHPFRRFENWNERVPTLSTRRCKLISALSFIHNLPYSRESTAYIKELDNDWTHWNGRVWQLIYWINAAEYFSGGNITTPWMTVAWP